MEEDVNSDVHEDKESRGETTEEEPDFSSEYEPETETDTASESEEKNLGNRYIIYQLPCTELLNHLIVRAILLLLTKMYIFYKNLHTRTVNRLN